MELDQMCLEIRREIAKYGYLSGKGHISSALSLVEIMVALYFDSCMDISKIKENSPDRDRVILSKGHGGLALYITLVKAGILEEQLLLNFASIQGSLSTHPVAGSGNGIEMSAGSLGQGIGFGCGVALSGKISNRGYMTYVIVGDGELQEGSKLESMLFASQMKLDNLVLFVDKNGLQISDSVENIVSLNPLIMKLKAFGFETFEVDGHDLNDIRKALEFSNQGRPKAIIANTVKGKGLSFIEGKNGWHGKGLTSEQYDMAMKELRINNG